MAMTAAVKDELSRLSVTKPCCRKAEMAALLRFAGGLHLVGGNNAHPSIVIEAELDAGSTARRLRKEIAEVYGRFGLSEDQQQRQGHGCHNGGR